MTQIPETTSVNTLLDQLSEIQDEAKKNKVQLTPEIQKYIRAHLEAVQQKLANREDVTEDDMKFMEDVRMWIILPEDLRLKYKNCEDAKNSEEVNTIIIQAKNLNISLHEAWMEGKKREVNAKQWLDLLHVAEAKGEKKEWIDETFRFSGGGRIEKDGDLNLSECKSLTTLPLGLEVNGGLNLAECRNLKNLPVGLKVAGDLDLLWCTSLSSLPILMNVGNLNIHFNNSLTSIPEDLKLNGYLHLEKCTSLATLPAGLKVNGYLCIGGCTSLSSLPAGLEVDGDLWLSNNLHEQVKKDAERLKIEGKIKGEIKYYNP